METPAMLSPESAEVFPPPEPNFRIDDLLDFSNSELCDDEALSDGGEDSAKAGNSTCGNGSIDPKEEMSASKGEDACVKAATSGLCVPPTKRDTMWPVMSQGGEDDKVELMNSELKFPVSHLAAMWRGHGRTEWDCSCMASSQLASRQLSHSYSTELGHGYAKQHHRSRGWDSSLLVSNKYVAASSLQERWNHDHQETRSCGVKDIMFKPVVEAPPRRCTHCLVQKTPQWRAGPMGPKTLCNACGVRYKSGRLVPEYRPAGSPTFVSKAHSNSHKRILEMRRVKEMEEEHMGGGKERPEEDEDSDCLSQSESSKEERRKEQSARSSTSQEDLNGSIWSEKGDGMGSICSEKEDPSGSICIENTDLTGLVCGGQLDAAALNRSQMTHV